MNTQEKPLLQTFLSRKGQFATLDKRKKFEKSELRAGWKNLDLECITTGISVKCGCDFSRLKGNEDKEGGELPWGKWLIFPYVIEHRGKIYFRFTTVAGSKHKKKFLLSGKEITEDEAKKYILPSYFKKKDMQVFNCKESDIINFR